MSLTTDPATLRSDTRSGTWRHTSGGRGFCASCPPPRGPRWGPTWAAPGVTAHSASCPSFHRSSGPGRGGGPGPGLCSLRAATEPRRTLRRPVPRPLFLAWRPRFRVLTWSQPVLSACETWEACAQLSTGCARGRHAIAICAAMLLSSLLRSALAPRKYSQVCIPAPSVWEPHSASCCLGPRGSGDQHAAPRKQTRPGGQSLQTSITSVCASKWNEGWGWGPNVQVWLTEAFSVRRHLGQDLDEVGEEPAALWGRMFQAEGTAYAKALGQEAGARGAAVQGRRGPGPGSWAGGAGLPPCAI